MVHEVYPSCFLASFRGLLLTSKSVSLATKNRYTFRVDGHLDKPLMKAMLEFLIETPVEKIQTRPGKKKIRLQGKFKKLYAKDKLKSIQVTLVNKVSLKQWMSY